MSRLRRPTRRSRRPARQRRPRRVRQPPRRGRASCSKIEGEGFYLSLGELKYQVQGSRQLNPDDIQDKALLAGVPADEQALEDDEVWFGVFLQVENEAEDPLRPAGDIEIIDTQEDVFKPVELERRPTPSPTAPRTRSRAASSRRMPDTPGFNTANQGSLLLFKLTLDALDNRPLELKMRILDDRPDRHHRPRRLAVSRRPARPATASPSGPRAARPGRPARRSRRRRRPRRAAPRRRRAAPRPARRRRTTRRCRSGRRAPASGARRRRGIGARRALGLASCRAARRCRSCPRRGCRRSPRRRRSLAHDGLHHAPDHARDAAGTTCVRFGGRPRSSVSRGRRPRPAIVAATHAICSAVACTLPWPIADEPTARPSPISLAAGIVLVAAPGMPGSVLKPNCSAVFDEALRAQAGAERREDRVARVRERLAQRAAAGLAVGVLELDALDHRLRLDGVLRVQPGELVLSTPASVMILNVEPGGCRPEKAIPASARISPVRGRTTATPPRRAPFAAIRRALHLGIDRGVHRRRRARLRPREHARAGAQLAAGPARDALLEDALQPGGADARVVGIAELAQARRRARAAAVRGRRRSRPRRRGSATSAPGPAPAGCRCAPGCPRGAAAACCASSALADREAREDHVRRPGDALVVVVAGELQPQGRAQRPEDRAW